jgi:hypothetical protein
VEFGGKLELSKCTYFHLHYSFTSTGAPFLTPGQVGPTMRVQQGDRQGEQTLQPTCVYNAYKTLGHYKEPQGSEKEQFIELKKASDTEALLIAMSSLDRREAWTYYFAMYLTKIGYTTPNGHMSYRKLNLIQLKAMQSIVYIEYLDFTCCRCVRSFACRDHSGLPRVQTHIFKRACSKLGL